MPGYLEMLTEHLIDELLARVGLSRESQLRRRARVPAAAQHEVRAEIRRTVRREANDWLLENFATRLFIATGGVPLAANDDRPAERVQAGK